ncbi:glycine betaine ABC transporter substrate-binding protein [Pseudomonas sp. B21-056]|jgi:glycine betaine/proline transport system substrate-binding protein|uniref:glycine betaine ABC transporter substrate-binding protein n=1 Tax=Pseudomonas sp. B21-056 TaxID=2895495 RepID=UPI00222E9459|nr:glycine betaine ABC transporter substrate-binding protein [Pseudomonas sp. B21-056]UZE26078.1 glycine betaine ABC transporter substrate-binding protein [Pseudomonas sp. B21-056]
MNKILKALLLGFCLICSAASNAADSKAISIGVNSWAENIAVANMWKILLEEKDYKVTLQNAGKIILYNSVAQGKIDVTFEVWLPTTDNAAYQSIKDKVQLIGPWLSEANLGLAVPDYVDIKSIDELNAHKDEFQWRGRASIFGIDAGTGLMGLTDKAMAEYKLDYTLLPSSEAAMLQSLDRAMKRKEPIVVTLWKPHWVWAKKNLRYLDDPKKVYGTTDSIHGIAAQSFKADHPEAERWLQQWKMDEKSLGELMATINENGTSTPEKGAKAWIDANRATVDAWLK